VASDESAEAIRRRMAELRRELTIDVRDVGESARELASPMYYIRHFPWASAAVAAGIGFLLVPKKKHVVQNVVKPDPEMLAELVRKEQVKIDANKVTEDRQSMLKGLVVMGLTWGLRTGLNYMAQRITTAAAHKGNEDAEKVHGPSSAQASSSTPEPSPAEDTWKTSR
jgi:hypothetical protein